MCVCVCVCVCVCARNFHEVKSLKAFLPLEKIVPHREQQQRSNNV